MHTDVTSLNGVALYTRTGTPKKRFNEDERRKIHDATLDDLKAFMNLFCPRGVTFSKTSGGAPRKWTTPKSRDWKTGDWKNASCTEKDVLRHLQAELFPGQLAWHLVCVRRLSPDLATGHLNKWVYKTGNGISKDVTSDLKNRTSRVAEQNASIVAWVISRNEGRKGNQQ
jgi:hypothetical protein